MSKLDRDFLAWLAVLRTQKEALALRREKKIAEVVRGA